MFQPFYMLSAFLLVIGMLYIYRTLNHIDCNALWIDLNAENIDRNASQCNADVYVKQLHLLT